MLATLTMTIIAVDRPGIVQRVAACAASHGGNWLESRMCRLGGQFAGIVRVEIPESAAAALAGALRALAAEGLQITVHQESAAQPGAGGDSLAHLEIVGHDRPGIVREITSVLAHHGVNVEEFSSERVNAPMDGSSLFQARASVRLPTTVSIALLRADLERIAADLMVDVSLRPPSP